MGEKVGTKKVKKKIRSFYEHCFGLKSEGNCFFINLLGMLLPCDLFSHSLFFGMMHS